MSLCRKTPCTLDQALGLAVLKLATMKPFAWNQVKFCLWIGNGAGEALHASSLTQVPRFCDSQVEELLRSMISGD